MKPKLLLGLALVLSGHCFAAIISPKLAEEYQPIAYQETISIFQRIPSFLPKNVQTNNLKLTLGHKWYSFNYQAVLSGKILSTASPSSGWNYLMMCGTNMVGVTELGLDAENHWQFGGTIFRGDPDPFWVALQKAEKLPQIKNLDYELRFLSLAMDFQAIWLHGTSDDIIIPLPSTSRQWVGYQPYSESEIIKLLQPAVEKSLNKGGGSL